MGSPQAMASAARHTSPLRHIACPAHHAVPLLRPGRCAPGELPRTHARWLQLGASAVRPTHHGRNQQLQQHRRNGPALTPPREPTGIARLSRDGFSLPRLECKAALALLWRAARGLHHTTTTATKSHDWGWASCGDTASDAVASSRQVSRGTAYNALKARAKFEPMRKPMRDTPGTCHAQNHT